MKNTITFRALKEGALAYAKEVELNQFITYGAVAAALLAENGQVYYGISLDTACSMGFCAEHGAVADMLKHGVVHVEKMIAVTAAGVVVPPCGRCRELLSQLTIENANTQVMVDEETVVPLHTLLPYDWKTNK